MRVVTELLIGEPRLQTGLLHHAPLSFRLCRQSGGGERKERRSD